MRRAALVLLLVAGCGGDQAPPEPTPRKVAAPPKASPVSALTPTAPAAEQTKEGLLAEARKRQLSNEDFTESENNRDPFRSYLSTFAVQVVVNKQHKIVLEKFALDELKLIAIVGGEGAPSKAMFVDPGGMGVAVQRGDHVSKADALITRIAPDRVFFQIEEDAGGGKPKVIERVRELHAGDVATQ
jgi:type IV pilus assembly protein PilP